MAEKASLISINKTKAAFNKVLADFSGFCRSFGIFTQISFIAYSIYSLIMSIHDMTMLIVKALTLGIIVVYFIFDLATQGKHDEEDIRSLRKTIGLIFRIIKYVINLSVIGIAVYEIFTQGADVIAVISLGIMSASLLVKILAEIVRFIFERYVRLIMLGIQMDIEAIQDGVIGKTVDVLGNKRATLIELIDKPLAALSAKMGRGADGEPETVAEAAEEIVDAAEDKDRLLLTTLAEEAEAESAEKRAEKEEKKKARLNDALQSVKTHLSSIFKRKKK